MFKTNFNKIIIYQYLFFINRSCKNTDPYSNLHIQSVVSCEKEGRSKMGSIDTYCCGTRGFDVVFFSVIYYINVMYNALRKTCGIVEEKS